MKLKIENFLVRPGRKLELKKRPTKSKSVFKSEAEYQALLSKHVEQLDSLQSLLYAHDRYALLLIFQAMDAAGKDSTIKHVMSGVNPQGCQVYSFKHPSLEELDHDFLWRTTRCLPERGRIGIFNRSYYEEVLVVRVHPEILQAENLPEDVVNKKHIWDQRYRSIVELEAHLRRNGTVIIKFFLHVSKEEQRKRFLKRIDDPKKNWKFNSGDLKERKLWKQYMQAYEDCFAATSTKRSPWYVVPADDKKSARLIVSHIILETLRGLKMHYPTLSTAQKRELKEIRKQLEE